MVGIKTAILPKDATFMFLPLGLPGGGGTVPGNHVSPVVWCLCDLFFGFLVASSRVGSEV